MGRVFVTVKDTRYLIVGFLLQYGGDRGEIGVTKENSFTLFARFTLNCTIASSRSSTFNKSRVLFGVSTRTKYKTCVRQIKCTVRGYIYFTRSRSNPKKEKTIYTSL